MVKGGLMMNLNEKDYVGVISFLDYQVVDAEFKLNRDFNDNGEPISIDFKLGHGFEKKDNIMQVGLGAKIFENSTENNYPFEISVEILGFFESDNDDINSEGFLPNALAILYPYLRSTITNITANANVQPLILPTINILSYLKDSDTE